MERKDEFRVTPIVLTGVVSAILLFVVIVLMNAILLAVKAAEVERKSTGVAPEMLSRNRNREMALLHEYRWIDEKGGVVRIPIERAIELIVEKAFAKPAKRGKRRRRR